ncbi:MAG TPA: hypothetical protein VGU23_10385 [Acidobacteriaceae bacterium]|nr:hypothetical protein [Acidobacteriaceae bacterium]
MSRPDYEFDDATATQAAGTPQGDGDFETDNLPSTGETSSGGQLNTGEADRRKNEASRAEVPGPQQPTGVEKGIEEAGGKLEEVADEISTGKLML